MYKQLFFITISFATFFNYAMISHYDPYTLDNMPIEILKEILDTNGKINQNDLKTYKSYKDCILFNQLESLTSKKMKNNVILNEKIIGMCDIAAIYANNVVTLSLINKQLCEKLELYKRDLILIGKDILLRPDYFKNFLVHLIDIKGHFIIDGLDSNNNKLYIQAYIGIKQRVCKTTNTRYTCPTILFHGQLFCPIEEYSSNNTKSTNTPILSAIKEFALASTNDCISLDTIHNLFSTMSQEAFSEDIFSQEKLAKCLALCSYIYSHFNDFSYTEPRQIINFKNSWGFTMAEFDLTFDMGPKNQSCIPLKLIKDILEVKIN